MLLDPQALASDPRLEGVGIAASSGVTSMHQMLYGLCQAKQVRFLMSGQPLSHAEVLSPAALLPAVAWCAQDAGSNLLQADFGCVLKKVPGSQPSLLGVRCVVPPITGHIADITRALFFAHFTVELFGLRENALIEIMPLYEVLQPVFAAHAQAIETEGSLPWPQMSPKI